MISSKQANNVLIQVKQRLLSLKQKQKNYTTSQLQIKWPKSSCKKRSMGIIILYGYHHAR